MVAPEPLPEPLGSTFTTAEALRLGVSRKRLRAGDLVAPRHGVRMREQPADVRAVATAFASRMAPTHAFAGVTAARLWGLPVAHPWRADEPLVIGVPVGATATRARGTRVRRFDPRRLVPGELEGLRTLWPAAAVMSMARETPHADLVVLLDALITPSEHYPGLRVPQRPFASVEQLAAFADRCRGVHGRGAFRVALADVRTGVDSPPETRSRLAIVAAGLPEPTLQHEVWVDGELRAKLDLAYPEWLIAVEYEGEHHLTDPAQWAKDIRRQELLESLGWIVIRATKADLRHGGAGLIARVRSALARRGVAA
ncbi:endonuclease domain-containing protein [Agrococcus sediminis]|uniref:endonuclease domain-containing protein n=1 Tax=Agrococcus sediminis TaxID=2599924 RepID=UPI00343645DB